ncbi:hypothetical protein [Sporosarcina limicola]|uniref:Uncharacterized protein n=1 Tax=Sporosarcina limicola TaxID=34101 RepID=A0A927MLV1_9BACL|nr:hypothetical protein [Sporosarcina limicola]MBE1555487.1 hypothetical protein [Sporosarcina limicola]
MEEGKKLSQNDLIEFKVEKNEARALIKHYSCQYKGQEHYDQLGASCAMLANATVNTIIGSAQYLNGSFLMPDEIQVERVADWFISNKAYECEHYTITFYLAHYIKRKTNALYRAINKGGYSTTLTILGNKAARKEFEKQIQIRKIEGVKSIRC